jgi:Na+-driven multidrug efflux pump
MFQGVGKGMNALAVTILRTIILTPPTIILFVSIFDMGLTGVWWGFVVSNTIGSLAAFIWAKTYMERLNGKKALKSI